MQPFRYIKMLTAIFFPLFISCGKEVKEAVVITEFKEVTIDTAKAPDIEPTMPKRPDFILADLDGDEAQDSVIIITDRISKKEGLRIVYGNRKMDTLGMGKEVLGQGFDDVSWAGLFEKAPKGEKYANNVDENGEILSLDEIPDDAWITLPNDGIDIHAAEACGGGIIYLENGQYKWIQQE